MQAIIFANRNGNELMPLNQFYSPALLPVSNKSVIEYTLEDLANAGIKQVKLVVSSQVYELKAAIGNGERWGLEIDYFLSRDQEDVSKVIPRLLLDKKQSILLARADMLRSPCIKSFVRFSEQMPSSFVIAKINNKNAGLLMLPAARSHTETLNWPLANTENLIEQLEGDCVTQVLHGDCFMLDSLSNYMQANQSMAMAKVIGSAPTGRYISSATAANGFYVGAKTKTGQLRTQNAWGVIGDNSQIDESVDMQQNVIVGNNCLIDKKCCLNNCIILDGSYVGQDLNVSNAIVCQSLLITPDSGGYIEINDQCLIASNQVNDNSIAINDTGSNVSLFQRLAASLLFAAGLMLSPLLIVNAIFSSSHKPLYRQQVTINNQKFNTWRWNVGSLFISRLPQLILVITGKLNLVGCSPFNNYYEKHKKTQKYADLNFTANHEYGLYGPIQLHSNSDITHEEQMLIEAEFAQLKTNAKLLKLVKLSQSHNRNKTHSKATLG